MSHFMINSVIVPLAKNKSSDLTDKTIISYSIVQYYFKGILVYHCIKV